MEFHEWEVREVTDVRSAIAHRSSAYRKAGILNGSPYGGGGRKFIQLSSTNGRWLINSILWQDGDEVLGDEHDAQPQGTPSWEDR